MVKLLRFLSCSNSSRRRSLGFCLLVLFANATAFAQLDSVTPAAVTECRKQVGIVRFTSFPNDGPIKKAKPHYETATGFVIPYDGDGKSSYVLTCKHVLGAKSKDVESGRITFSLAGDVDVLCYPEKWIPGRDLLLLRTQRKLDVPGLPLVKQEDLPVDVPVWLLGGACGLDIAVQDGGLHAKAASAKIILETLGKQFDIAKMGLLDDTLLVRHNAGSCFGYSGGPVVTKDGNVIAVHIAHLDVGEGECFGVACKHFDDLVAIAEREQNVYFQALQTNGFIDASGFVYQSHEAITGSMAVFEHNGVKVDGGLQYGMRINEPNGAEFAKRLATDLRGVDIEQYLADRELHLILNSAFGFSFFVPEGVQAEALALDRPGIQISFDSDKELLGLSVFAFDLNQYVCDAQNDFLGLLIEDDVAVRQFASISSRMRFNVFRDYVRDNSIHYVKEEFLAFTFQQPSIKVADSEVSQVGKFGPTSQKLVVKQSGKEFDIRFQLLGSTALVSMREYDPIAAKEFAEGHIVRDYVDPLLIQSSLTVDWEGESYIP